MKIQTSRFGVVQITSEDLLDFPEGLLGFASLRKFVLLDEPSDDVFAWLQSAEEPTVAFPVLEPELFVSNYNVQLTKHDLDSLKLPVGEIFRTFVIITIPQDPTLMTANLKAPIIINVSRRLARQCVLQDNQLAIREPIFNKLQQRVVQFPQTPIKSQSVDNNLPMRRAPVRSPEQSPE
ncbi:MAG: flagellar assembly protein FliW [Bdellovibrionales bacterium]|nr:flagellar assembly protein FliW [Bdellovibrionales bacterium]